METRANHLLVGAFVLALVAVGFVFVVWVATDADQATRRYLIYFEGSVGGLGKGGDVRYRGIRVGAVERARIDPENPQRVEVTVEVDRELPIREGDVATLKLQGITGSSYVDIGGAGPESPPLEPAPGRRYPVIPSRPSALEQLFAGAPDLISQGTIAASGMAELVGEENQAAVRGILADIQSLTATLAARDEQIGRILDNFDRSGAELAGAATAVRGAAERVEVLTGEIQSTLTSARTSMGKIDSLVEGDVTATVADLRRTSASLRDLTDEATALIAENRVPISEFTHGGLAELENFVLEARLLVAQLSRVAARIEDEGLSFLLGSSSAGYEADEE